MSVKKQEYLAEIRRLEGLKNAILYAITVHKKENRAEFFLITDTPYSEEEEKEAALVGSRYVPEGFSASVRIVKRTPDAEIIRQKIYAYVSEAFPAAAAFLKEEDIEVEMLTSGAQFYFAVASGEQTLFSSGHILDEVSAYLKSIFCGSFYGAVRIVEKTYDTAVLNEKTIVQEETLTTDTRFFPIENFQKIDGADPVPKWAV
ncbi:MAG: hypothetical protein IJX18_01635, partial [Clostridia bacterium]|nr:hypothetical protein [Clostridia bacterium]